MHSLRSTVLIIFLAGIPGLLFSQNKIKSPAGEVLCSFQNVHYGIYDKTTFDLYLPDTIGKEKFPLVIYFHGGSFIHGDKSKIKDQLPLITELLNNGIAYASVNYRYRKDDDSLGVRACLNDAVWFLQFIRYHADKYRIDQTHIGSYGESAGAGTSLYLAFHDDFASLASKDPVARESTRISCVGAIGTQATYNLFRWKRIIPHYWLVFRLKKKKLEQQIAHFYGFTSYKTFRPLKKKITRSVDMLRMISPDDPPVWLCTMASGEIIWGAPKNDNQLFHHPAHAIAIGKKARKEGVENYVITDEKEKSQQITLADFFVKYLK